MYYRNSSYYFLIFIVVGLFSLIGAVFAQKAIRKNQDAYLIARMQETQDDIIFHKSAYQDMAKACFSGEVSLLNIDLNYDLGNYASCFLSKDKKHLALVAELSSGEKYCVDTEGHRAYLNSEDKVRGYCLET